MFIEVITLAFYERGKQEQARIMIMSYTCTNKIRPLLPREDGTATQELFSCSVSKLTKLLWFWLDIAIIRHLGLRMSCVTV